MAGRLIRSNSYSAQGNFDYPKSLYAMPSSDATLGSPVLDSQVFDLGRGQTEPWNHLGQVNDAVPRLMIATQSPHGSKPMPVWNAGSWNSPNLLDGPSLQFPSPTTSQTTPSLMSDLETSAAAHDMSRTPSNGSNVSYELHDGIVMSRMGSVNSSYSFGSDQPQAYMHSYRLPADQYHFQTSKHRNSLASPDYLAAPPSPYEMARSSSNQSNLSVSSAQSYAVGQVASTANGKDRVTLLPSSANYQVYKNTPIERRNSRSRFVCTECNEWPQGFRGEHELTRHLKLRHEATRTMWICVAPSDKPGFLDNCKHCKAGKKYGAYYNAAQHVRRCHFSPIKRGRKSKSESSATNQSKMNLRERKWPPMNDMKKFLKEVTTDIHGNVISICDVKGDPVKQHSSNVRLSGVLTYPQNINGGGFDDDDDDDEEEEYATSAGPSPIHAVQHIFGDMSYPPSFNDPTWATPNDALISTQHLLQGVNVLEEMVAPGYITDSASFNAEFSFD